MRGLDWRKNVIENYAVNEGIIVVLVASFSDIA